MKRSRKNKRTPLVIARAKLMEDIENMKLEIETLNGLYDFIKGKVFNLENIERARQEASAKTYAMVIESAEKHRRWMEESRKQDEEYRKRHEAWKKDMDRRDAEIGIIKEQAMGRHY